MLQIPFWVPVLAWHFCSVAVIFCNKLLYSGLFPYPVTLMVVHMMVSTAGTQIFSVQGFINIPKIHWKPYCTSVIPLGVLFAMSVSLSNLAAARLTMACSQMLKGLAPLFILAVMFVTRVEKLRPSLVLIIFFLTCGGALVNVGATNFDGIGVALQMSSLLCEAIRIAAIKSLLVKHLPGSNPLVALALFAPLCVVFLLPIALFIEPLGYQLLFSSNHILYLVLASSLCALGLNCCNVWALSRDAGPLLLSLAGVVKDMFMLILSIIMLGNQITSKQTTGYALALFGLLMFRVYSAPGGSTLSAQHVVKTALLDPATRIIGAGMAVIFVLKNDQH
jgi:drug/metabolite transporter (DMT)-like permease